MTIFTLPRIEGESAKAYAACERVETPYEL